jgi:heat shock protein 1/8
MSLWVVHLVAWVASGGFPGAGGFPGGAPGGFPGPEEGPSVEEVY